MTARFVREDVVHLGYRVSMGSGSKIYLLCDRRRIFSTPHGWLGCDNPPLYEPGVEVFHVFDDADCMTCIVVEGRLRG